MKSYEIKNLFIDYFKRNNHIELEEYSLIPLNDKSLLFTNSGMVQFKNIFLGFDEPVYSKVVTSQRCVRLGGKHNDLDTIGESFHHNTSFEMLGNFSFKDTSQVNTIKLCWNFLVDVLKLDRSRLYVTVHEKDKKIYDIWNNIIGLDSKKIMFGSDDSNFWSMDECGPCGYCTEIFYDISSTDKNNLLEIWNIVFIEFNKNEKSLTKLNNLYVDTGMGLERITSVLQGHYDNFKIDSYSDLLHVTVCRFNCVLTLVNEKKFKLIVDHLKTAIFLIKEGLIPSNDGRGYILKKLIRRAILKKNELKFDGFLYILVDEYISILDKMNVYSINDIEFIKKILTYEEEKFNKTLKNGISFLENIILSGSNVDGKILFNLYDTYGLPLDYIKDVLHNYNLHLDMEGFDKEMAKQVSNSRKSSKFGLSSFNFNKTVFLGYDQLNIRTNVLGLLKDNLSVDCLVENDEAIVVTSSTSFYSEKGGQIGDIGFIQNDTCKFCVTDTKEENGIYFHYGKVIFGCLNIGDIVFNNVNEEHRRDCSNNHTSTHLLHTVLKKKLGHHIKQAGSYVSGDYLRFDFTHFSPLSSDEIKGIEDLVNTYILSNLDVKTYINFDKVSCKEIRTIVIGNDVSIELCGGTHALNTGNIGLFKILKETGIGNNLRRLEAVSGTRIIKIFDENENYLNFLAKKLKSNRFTLDQSVDKLVEKNKLLEKELSIFYCTELKNDMLNSNNFLSINNVNLITILKDKKYLNFVSDVFKDFSKAILLFYYIDDNKIYLKFYISKDVSIVNISDMIAFLEKNTFFKTIGKSRNISAIVLDNKEVSKYVFIYLKNNIKIGENNVNFN